MREVLELIARGAGAEEVARAYEREKQAQERARCERFGALAPADHRWPASFAFHEHSKLGLDYFPLISNEAVEALTHDGAYKRYPDAPRIALPRPAPLSAPLEACLKERASTRAFAPRPLALDQLAKLLELGCGVTRSGSPQRRTQPSGGALYPVEAYALPLSVTGVEPAIYHYAPLEHALEHVAELVAPSKLKEALGPQLGGTSPALVIVLSLIFARTQAKYGERGYRFGLLEAGHIAQSLSLVAAAQRLGAVVCGGFFDDPLNRALGLDEREEAAIYAVLIGEPATESSVDPG